MESNPSRPGRSAGRPRSTKARQAILDATLHLVRQESFTALTIEGIAREAGVGKPTIYRWWPSKGAIVLEALQQHAQQALPVPHNDSLVSRLESWLNSIFDILNGDIGKIVRGLMAEAQSDPTFAVLFRTEFITTRRQPLLTILHDGLKHGELPSSTNIEIMADLIYGAMWYRLLTQHAPLDATYAHDIIQTLLPNSA
ncbi:TetR family transcriptional regulator [Dictyobacter alpinus]|uniref:TetR family transcriptional regulator n=1 Tax=Dictyobacter alpinus TaxID=2014873 RepID=A0A402BFS1_9CHLR|nr:TetR/AcrR family transcriptional regulator [Dictyobacter alpinus]GCE30112.1 TetR family transcriptional regulator [Dictyobacter alpinus]